LEIIHTSFPRSIAPHLPDFLSASLIHLQLLYPTFVACHLAESIPPPPSEEDPIDLPQLICPLIDFVSATAKDGKAKGWFSGEGSGSVGRMGELVSEIIRWAQMTKEDVNLKSGLE
jgi:importin-9